MSERIGFIGAGQMATALVQGLLHGGEHGSGRPAQTLRAMDPLPAQRSAIANACGIETTDDAASLAAWADTLVLATKPQALPAALAAVAPHVRADARVISIAAGVTLAALRAALPAGCRVMRAMPNTPAKVGAGVTAIAAASTCSAADIQAALALFASVGLAIEVPESQLDAITALSGSGPGFVLLVLEALADGGVAAGLPRPLAQQLASQTLLGTAKLASESQSHPAELRNQVTSPAGTTAAGLQVLERSGVRAAFVEAVQAARHRAAELSLEPT